MENLDQIDRRIIAHLQYDGRLPYTEIAANLGLSEGAIRRRVKMLRDAGILQVVGIVDPYILGWKAAAMIGVIVQAGTIDSVAEQVAQFPEVSYLFMASGGFDLFVEVFCRDNTHLVSFLSKKLQVVSGVQRTETFMLLKTYKLSYRWGEAEPPRTGHTAAIDSQGLGDLD
ncbi:MAG: Lrp/AsnC family transcriptional regulator [Anaerolineales bacterium]|nr:Lrp/AsnC family transcriptional regulator [Anaerolineales bacterium]